MQCGIGVVFQRDADDQGPLLVKAFVPGSAGGQCNEVLQLAFCMRNSGRPEFPLTLVLL